MGILSGGVMSIAADETWYDAPSGNGWAGAADNFNGVIDGSVRIFEVCGCRRSCTEQCGDVASET
jgi:hypothetical protein